MISFIKSFFFSGFRSKILIINIIKLYILKKILVQNKQLSPNLSFQFKSLLERDCMVNVIKF